VFQQDNDTYVKWRHDKGSKSVIFTLYSKLGIGDWVALGISDNRDMKDADIKHVGIEDDGTPVPSDRPVAVVPTNTSQITVTNHCNYNHCN